MAIIEGHLKAYEEIYRYVREIENCLHEIKLLTDWMSKDITPHVMTLEEVKEYIRPLTSPYEYPIDILPLWTESPSGNFYRHAGNIMALLLDMRDEEDTTNWVYGKDWRCWTSKPIKEDDAD